MTFRSFLTLSTAGLLLACSPAAVAPAQSDFKLEYEKFTLDNGLDVILHVDRSDPIVALTTVIHAGSNREKPGRTGFAHFFEHMAFNDSENVPRGWNRKAIPDWGGQRNGGTWSDGTIYYEVVPKDAFDKILWIDSDRLGYMINTVTTEALEREKQVVKNEKRQRVDNAAYGYTQEIIRKALYPEGHPYNWTVIGSLPDLQAATLDDLRVFYDDVYGPNNATLAIAGDIDIEETKRKVQLWFGEIKRGKDVAPLPPMPVAVEQTQSLYFEDNFAKLPELRLTFPTVEAYHKDEAALDVLAQILAGSKNSVLYKEIVELEKLAPNVSSYNNSMELAGEFVFRVRANAGTDLDAVNAALQSALIKFETQGVDPSDLQRIKAEQETQLYSGLSTILGKSNQLASDSEFAGDPAYAIQSAKNITAITADDIMAVFQTYIKNKPSIITSLVPKGQNELSVTGAKQASVWIEEVKSGAASETVSQGAEAQYEKTPSVHDRSEPPFGPLPLIEMPDVWEAELPNSVSLLGIENSETPLVNFYITLDGGSFQDPLDKKGTAALLARLMNEGSASKSASEMEQAIGLLGSDIRVSAGREEIAINVTSLSKNFEATLALVQETLSQPRWEDADFERVKSAALTAIKGQEASPNAIASNAFGRILYGDQHPSGHPSTGSAQSVNALTLEDLKTAHAALKTAKVNIHIAGDIPKMRAQSAFKALANQFEPPKAVVTNHSIADQDRTSRVYFVDVPGSKQSVITIGKLALSSTNPDANKLDFTNEKLGGGISSDLSQTLRIEKGYTYGAYSSVFSGKTVQPFRIRTSVRANATGASLEVMRDMLKDYGPSFSQPDVETVKQKLVKENTRAFESLNAKLGTLVQISKYGKSQSYVEDEQAQLVAMTLEDFKAMSQTYLNESDMVYIIVGDKATQLDPVREFAGGKVMMLDIYGQPVSD